MTTDYKSGGILLGFALLISLPSLGWAQLVPAQEPEPISYQSRLSELRKTEVALDAGTIAGPAYRFSSRNSMFNEVGHKDASEILKTAFNQLERNLPF